MFASKWIVLICTKLFSKRYFSIKRKNYLKVWVHFI